MVLNPPDWTNTGFSFILLTVNLFVILFVSSTDFVFVVLMINVPQSNVNYVTNITISKITNHACKAHINNLYVKRINMCIDKRAEFGEIFVYFSQMKRYLRLSKNSAVL